MIPSRLRPYIGSFVWSATEGLMYPVLMVVATPMFLRTVGTEAFGLWLLVNSIVAMGGLVGLGTVEATTRLVAAARGEGDQGSARAISSHNLFLGFVSSAGVALILGVSSPLIAERLFPAMGERGHVVISLMVGAVMLVVQQVSGVLAAVIRGFEQFHTAAKIEFAVRFTSVVLALVLAWQTAEIANALYGFMLVNMLGIGWRFRVVQRLLGTGLWPPAWQAAHARVSWSYAGWNWLNAIMASVFAGLDRLLVGAWLGAVALAHYGIALQLASFVLVLPTAGLAFLVPVMSRRARGAVDHDRSSRLALAANFAITGLIALPLVLFGKEILNLWVGVPTAREITSIFHWLLGAFTISSLAAAPQYLLMARGEVRYCSKTFLVGATVGAMVAVTSIPVWGLIGAACARYVQAATSLALYRRI